MKGRNIPFKKNYILGTSLVLTALVLGLMMVCTVRTLKSYDDTVKVRGLCEREVPADRVVLHINYGAQADELGSVRDRLQRNGAEIVRLLRAAGIDESEIMTGNPSVSDSYSETYYGNNQPRFRFRGNQNIRVATTKMDIVRGLERSLETDMLKQDVIISSWADYQFLGLNDIKPSMIAESLQNARMAADEFATASHSKIGKMRTASQGVFSIEDLDENTPQMKKVRVVTTVEYYLK